MSNSNHENVSGQENFRNRSSNDRYNFRDRSGGKREYVPALSKAAVSLGVAGLFIETHNDPDNAPSDGPNMLNLKDLKKLILKLKDFDDLAKN